MVELACKICEVVFVVSHLRFERFARSSHTSPTPLSSITPSSTNCLLSRLNMALHNSRGAPLAHGPPRPGHPRASPGPGPGIARAVGPCGARARSGPGPIRFYSQDLGVQHRQTCHETLAQAARSRRRFQEASSRGCPAVVPALSLRSVSGQCGDAHADPRAILVSARTHWKIRSPLSCRTCNAQASFCRQPSETHSLVALGDGIRP